MQFPQSGGLSIAQIIAALTGVFVRIIGDTMTGMLAIAYNTPVLRLQNTSAAANNQIWDTDLSATVWALRTRDDLGANGNAALSVTRSGLSVTDINFGAQLSLSGSIIVDANRHFRLRSYTSGTLPSASPAGQEIFVSDINGGAIAWSDGASWDYPLNRGGDTMTGDMSFNGGSSFATNNYSVTFQSTATQNFTVRGDTATNVDFSRSGNNANPPNIRGSKTRGTWASPTAILQNDIMFRFAGYGYTGTQSLPGGLMDFQIIAAIPSNTDMNTRLVYYLCPTGSIATTEILRADHATGLSMFGANVVIDQNRHFRLRSYTTGTLPSASPAGQEIYVSDVGSGSLAWSNGSTWLYPTTSVAVLSGTYTPTLTGVTNVAATSVLPAQYMRVGDVVTVSGILGIDATAAGGANTQCAISLPIASNFSATEQCAGVGNCADKAIAGAIFGDVAGDRAYIQFNAPDTALNTFNYTFTYRVI